MRGVRLASLLALVLALSGGFAVSSRSAQGPRVVASIAWYQASPAKQLVARRTHQLWHAGRGKPAAAVSLVASPVRSAYITHSLFQRPPPATA